MMLIFIFLLFAFIRAIKFNDNVAYTKHITVNPKTKIISSNSNEVTYDLNEPKSKMIIDSMRAPNSISFGSADISLPSITPLPLDSHRFNINVNYANPHMKKTNDINPSKNIKDINMISKLITKDTNIATLNEFNSTLSSIVNSLSIDSMKLSSQLTSELSRCKSLLQMLSIPKESHITNVSEKEKSLALSELEYQLFATVSGENVDKAKTSHVGIIAQDDIAKIVNEVRNELSSKELYYY